MFSKFLKFPNSKSIFISNSKSLLSNLLSDESLLFFLDNSVWLSLNFCVKRSLNIFSRILCGSEKVFSVSSNLFTEIDSILISRSSSYINENSLISWSFFFSSSDFSIFEDFDNFKYFNLNFLVIFEDSDLKIEGKIFGIFISFFSKLFLKISIYLILFPILLISIGIGSKIIVW